MHELSIAENIVEIIHQYVEVEKLPLVRSVSVDVGTFSGVVPDSLEFSFQAITAQTPLEKSFLKMNIIPFKILCSKCSKEIENDDGIVLCSECGSLNTKIISGKELHVKEIEVLDSLKEFV